MDHCWVPNDTIMQWLRLSSHMEWFPHPLQTYKRSLLTNIICSWWGYGAPTMLLPPHLWDWIWKVGKKIMDHCRVPKIIQSESALICPAHISLKGINTPYMSNMDVRRTQRLSAASTMTTWHHLLSTVTLNFQNCRGQTLPQWQRECIALHFASFNEESVSLGLFISLYVFSKSLVKPYGRVGGGGHVWYM
jgi:hypothetical protein